MWLEIAKLRWTELQTPHCPINRTLLSPFRGNGHQKNVFLRVYGNVKDGKHLEIEIAILNNLIAD